MNKLIRKLTFTFIVFSCILVCGVKAESESINPYPKSLISYQTHIQNIGWTNWVKNGEIAGTTGKSLRLEAIQVGIVSKNPGYKYNQVILID